MLHLRFERLDERLDRLEVRSLRLIDFVYHSSLGLRVIKKMKTTRDRERARERSAWAATRCSKREIVIDNLLVRIHFIMVMIWWTGLAPWEFGETPRFRASRLLLLCASERVLY